MTIVLDASALIAIEQGSKRIAGLVADEQQAGRLAVTRGGVVGQVWRGSGRQALLARMLDSVDVVALDDDLGRRAGALLARARTSDVIDAALVVLADEGDAIVTSDPSDLLRLAEASGRRLELFPV